MVAKKKTARRSTTKKTTAVEAAVEQTKKNEEDPAREARLQALREKRKSNEDDSPGWKMSGPEEGNERKRELVKKLIKNRKKRMAQGGALKKRAGQAGTRKKRLAKKGAARKKRLASGAARAQGSGEGLAQYPRLKALLAKRGGKTTAKPAAELAQLEERVKLLETALETILQKLEDAKILKS